MKASSDLNDPPESRGARPTKIEVQPDQIYQPERSPRPWARLSLETLVGRVIALSAISVGILVIAVLVAEWVL